MDRVTRVNLTLEVGIVLKIDRLATFTLGVIVTAVSVGAVNFANAAGDATIKTCANKTTGAMRYLSKGSCKKTEKSISWNQMGPQGLPGVAGATGTAGTKGDSGSAGTKGDAGTNGTNGANTNSQIKNICGDNRTTACAIGLKGPGGGIVFMTPSTLGNTSGLFYEAAPSTWSSPSGDPTSAWCSNSNTVLGVGSSVAGTGSIDGAARTTVMLGVCTTGAANLADAYTATLDGVVYGDWFLPSNGELNQMYVNRVAVGGFAGGFDSSTYWSSSEGSTSFTAWCQGFNSGSQGRCPKIELLYVRPVRAF
jgi:hypothetical protein